MRSNLLLLSLFILVACSSRQDETPAKETNPRAAKPIVGEFRTKGYPINEHEHVTLFQIPGYYEPTQCWVFVNEKTNTSHMRCDDEIGDALPAHGQELD